MDRLAAAECAAAESASAVVVYFALVAVWVAAAPVAHVDALHAGKFEKFRGLADC